MALSQSALSELLDAIRAGGSADVMRTVVRSVDAAIAVSVRLFDVGEG